MATSLVSMGKLNQAKKAGKPIPEGWALDAKGNPTTDPHAAQTPLPMGGAKGSGLSFMVECLASLIASNPLLAESSRARPRALGTARTASSWRSISRRSAIRSVSGAKWNVW